MLYRSFRLLRNEKKYAIFGVLIDKKEATSIDVEQKLRNQGPVGQQISIGLVDDTLRELEGLKLASYVGVRSPLTPEGKRAALGKFKTNYKCYRETSHAQLVGKFLRAYKSDNPLAEMQPDPEDILRSIEGMNKEDLKSFIEKFGYFYFFTSLLLGIRTPAEQTATTEELYSSLRGKISPREIQTILKRYPEFVKTSPEPITKMDKFKTRIARITGGRIFRAWREPHKASYSLTAEGSKIAERILKQGITPKDLGMELEFEEEKYTKTESAKKTVATMIGGMFIGCFAALFFYVSILALHDLNWFGVFLFGLGALFSYGVFSILEKFHGYRKRYRQKRSVE
ncbi:MAG: hypothetical protein ABSF24_02375 [Candidatus Bathyarchaeia archaeon]